MASIYNPEIKVAKIKKISSDAQDMNNSGFGIFSVTAEVTFEVHSDTESTVEKEALERLEHALS
jgi:hypothetical protein